MANRTQDRHKPKEDSARKRRAVKKRQETAKKSRKLNRGRK